MKKQSKAKIKTKTPTKKRKKNDEVFDAFYSGPDSLNGDGMVYITDGMWMDAEGNVEFDRD